MVYLALALFASLRALVAATQDNASCRSDDAEVVGVRLLQEAPRLLLSRQRGTPVSGPGPAVEPGLLQDGAAAEALRAVDDLWSGLDSVEPAAYQGLLQSAADVSPETAYIAEDSPIADPRGPKVGYTAEDSPKAAPGSPGKHSAAADDLGSDGDGTLSTSLQIAGMFDSGTNLLWALIAANLGERTLSNICPDNKHDHCFFWKHSPPDRLEKELDALQRRGQRVVLVSMVRSPLSQVVSWTKAPYDLGSCIQKATATAASDSHTRCYVRGEAFRGVAGVWNSYVQEYDRLQKANGHAYHRTMVVEYERLVVEPEAVVRKIAAALGLSVRSPFRMIEAPAKNHGTPHGREKALQDLRHAAWLRREPASREDVRSSLCRRLNSSAMRRHVYRTEPRSPVYGAPAPTVHSYMDDCAYISTGSPRQSNAAHASQTSPRG